MPWWAMFRRSPLGLVLLLAAAPVLTFVMAEGCGARLGGTGESCSKTADCADPLVCKEQICVDPGGSSTSSSSTSSSSSSTSSSSGIVDAGSTSACDTCLDEKCAASQAACDEGCLGIEACIETLCAGLGQMGSPDEANCFVQCQDEHPGSKQKHLDVVDCVLKNECFPPCAPYPQDYDACVVYMNQDLCKELFDACQANLDCQNYRECTKTCATLAACLMCDATPEAFEGRKMYEAYNFCIASECLAESWLQ